MLIPVLFHGSPQLSQGGATSSDGEASPTPGPGPLVSYPVLGSGAAGAGGAGAGPKASPAMCSATRTVGKAVVARGTSGKTLASAIRTFASPCTVPVSSTTACGPSPIAQVPAGCQ